MNSPKHLWAVELDIEGEAGRPYWVIHDEGTTDRPSPCIFETRREARIAAKGRDHASRIVRFDRVARKEKL